MALNKEVSHLRIRFSYRAIVTRRVFTVRYNTNVTTTVKQFTVRYRVSYPEAKVVRFKVSYEHYNGPKIVKYNVRYLVGRELRTRRRRFKVRYNVGNNTTIRKFTVLYEHTGTASFKSKYRYKVTYNHTGTEIVTRKFTVRYNHTPLTTTTKKFNVSYLHNPAELTTISPLLIRRESGDIDAVFRINNYSDIEINETLFVFSNLPRFEIVELDIDSKTNPHATIVTNKNSMYNTLNTLFDDKVNDVMCYVLVKNVEEANAISLDLYNKRNNYIKMNDSDSYFFNLDVNAFEDKQFTLDSINYVAINRASNEYEYKYLNFVQVTASPMFRIATDCCFSRKVNKNTYTYCSPF